MNPVPHLDLRRQHAALREEILAVVASVVDTCDFVGGPRLAAFERDFAAACDSQHCIGVANGTDAIQLALRAVGVGPGDDVLLPAFTFIATAGAVLAIGARPVLVDVDEDTALLAPREVARRMTERTRAVIAVHLFGLPCDPAPLRDAIASAARGRSVALVEDCAQAHGARHGGVRVGALGDIAAFSFYPTKNLGALGDGGAITTSSAELAECVRRLSDHGRPTDPARRGEHLVPGVNSRLDSLQAGVLSLKLARLDAWNARRQSIAAAYATALSGRSDYRLQASQAGSENVFYLHAARHAQRQTLLAELAARGVSARATYPHALHGHPALESLGHAAGDFPASEAWGREIVTLPMFAEMTDDEVERVVAALPAALDACPGARGA